MKYIICNGDLDLYYDANSLTNLIINSNVPHSFSGTPGMFELAGLTLNATSNTTTTAYNIAAPIQIQTVAAPEAPVPNF